MGNAEHQKGPNTEARLLPKPHRTMRRTANHAGLDSKVELEPAVSGNGNGERRSRCTCDRIGVDLGFTAQVYVSFSIRCLQPLLHFRHPRHLPSQRGLEFKDGSSLSSLQ